MVVLVAVERFVVVGLAHVMSCQSMEPHKVLSYSQLPFSWSTSVDFVGGYAQYPLPHIVHGGVVMATDTRFGEQQSFGILLLLSKLCVV